MKIAWNKMRGVGLLLLGLATAGGGRSFAADINTESFAVLAGSSSATAAGTAVASPFKDESASAPAKVVAVEPAIPSGSACCPVECSPSCATGILCDNGCYSGAPGRVWFNGEYLHWWTSGAHLPPMVSTLTGPQETVPVTLFGGDEIRNGDHDGYRMDFGMWLDCCHCWGIEADYFDVTGRPDGFDSGFSNGYNADGTEHSFARIVFDPAATPNLQVNSVAEVGFTVGRITVQTSDYFQSAGIWLRRQLRASEWSTSNCDVNWTDSCARTFRLDAIGGYRFARLIDSVDEQDDSFVFNQNQPNALYQYTYLNSYKTVNNFNGTELGLDGVYTMGRWSLDVVGKVALGFNNEYVRLYNQEFININDVVPGTPAAPQNANPTQEFSRNRFAAIPELTVTAGYQVTDHLKFTVGYDLLYWTAVVRAADQIAVEPTTGYPYGTLVGNYSTLPAFSFNESHFLAQGLRLGGEFRF